MCLFEGARQSMSTQSFIPLFSVYPYTGKTMDVEIVKNINYNIQCSLACV